jgi:hypothetical protein
MIWFGLFVALCAGFLALRATRPGGFGVSGQRVNPITILLALGIILIAFGLFAATQLGIIADHAP